jgi:diguanylate cyclase (GGDEF)-like protein
MIAPPLPPNEDARVRALHALEILDSGREERFDRITRLARRTFDVPIAIVSLVDSERQWFKSVQGLDAPQTSREVSFCGHSILGAQTLVVEDARTDVRFHDNPLVTGAPDIRFYAGRPIAAPCGHRVGTLCIIDSTPRDLAPEDLQVLDDLAGLVERDLAQRVDAITDGLTQLSNRKGFEVLSDQVLRVCRRLGRPSQLVAIDLDRFKHVNDTFGHDAGDALLRACGDLLLDTFRDADVVARVGGDEFAVLLTGATQAQAAIARFGAAVAAWNQSSGLPYALAFSAGAAAWDPARDQGLAELMHAADASMYRQKRGRRLTG